ncbi:hypothetical protein [Leptolinea tardivitalis]|uniref:Uncharacterized protein n=1 Tax=Leptolinea tardivitalis TaxID=229920 RepID=A0A0N8GKT9_9CHLR|nr:hypothetical protein [Leptolinea tardivitalis]KPL70626.1 hypothetical protein ADM99_16120 [Leptolinea tardivitalis]GAP22247.1 hypothetical protein LTAR_02472 [Leptolinea tardivitalis]
MSAPVYPSSGEVSPGQPTASSQYNNLRKDALTLGAAPEDARTIGQFFARFISGVRLEYLATNRLRIPFVTTNPPTLMINGYMCQASANVDLPAGCFSGLAATWYIFARRNPGSSSFTLEINTSPVEGTDQRLIGQCYWDGSNVSAASVNTYSAQGLGLPDYDSGWFAVADSNTYTKAHNLGQTPRLVVLLHATSSNPGVNDELVLVNTVSISFGVSCLGWNSTNIYAQSGTYSGYGTCLNMRRGSSSGYWRLQAWR